jgi:alpha-tubulin suppressor-like RCC1 family protein
MTMYKLVSGGMNRLFFLLAGMLCALSAVAQPKVVAWGDNAEGQLNIPLNVTNVSAISGGGFYNLALRSNGTVVAWGTSGNAITNVPLNATNVIAISAGFGHAMALRSNGTIVSWGDNLYGQTNIPPGVNGIKAIAACGFHNMVLRTNGTVFAWGYNDAGQTNVPVSATNVAALAGGYMSMALRSNGTVLVWGSLLAGSNNVQPTLTNISAIACGLSHAIALRSNGTIVAWGDNFYGQTNIPPGLTNVASIGCGSYSSFAIDSNGLMYAWGRNTHGQTNLFSIPQPFNGVISLMGGDFHSLALGYLNDNFANRMPLVGTNILMRASNLDSTTEYGFGEPFHHEHFTGHTVWFSWTAPASGGVVLTATCTDGSVATPILAVYTGSALTNLVQLSSNSPDSTTFDVARAVFTAVAGQTYQIVFAGDSNFGGGEGFVSFQLTLFPSPANDLFANAIPIAGNYYGVTGSFVGSGRETNEPTHSEPDLGQTLWWQWTAPTNAPNPASVRLMADGVSFPPGMGVYTGSSVAALTPTTLTRKTNGMSSDATFNVTPGTTYRIALAGRQTDPDSSAPLFGAFKFRLNLRALAISITNLVATTNANGSVPFTANARINNFSGTGSHPLRVVVSAISGRSTTIPLTNAPPSTITNLSISSSTTVAAGGTTLVPISGTAPAPDTSDPGNPIAYGVYAQLQEQPLTNFWFTLDETLVTFDKWPGVGEIFGPGGGVIRLDPDYLGMSAFNPLLSVRAVGPPTLNEGTPTPFSGRGTYADNTIHIFTNTAWTATKFTITTNGLFTGGSITSNTPVTINAPYYSGGLLYTVTTNITVLNLPSPTLSGVTVVSNKNFAFQLTGVPGRSHVIEATTNLSPPQIWLPLVTNATAGNGILNYTNGTTLTNFPRRFFRAREF